jgi:cellulose biosynthesis protein BcsQ
MNPAQKTLKILVTSQKGGVGKSTLAANLAVYLHRAYQRSVTLVDMDLQASSSSWLLHAPPCGVTIQHMPVPLRSGLKEALLEARKNIRRAAHSSSIVLADLTWSAAMDAQFLFDFDLVLIPTSVSGIELDATVHFISELRWVFDTRDAQCPTLLICPSRVTEEQMAENLFSQQRFPISFMLTPPLIHAAEAKTLFEQGFLMDLPGDGGEAFRALGAAIFAAGTYHQEKGQRGGEALMVKGSREPGNILTQFVQRRAQEKRASSLADVNETGSLPLKPVHKPLGHIKK